MLDRLIDRLMNRMIDRKKFDYLMNRIMTIAAKARVTKMPAKIPRKGVNSTTTEDSESR